MAEIRRSYCGLCHPRCGLLLEIENGKIVKVKGDPDHPIESNVNILCPDASEFCNPEIGSWPHSALLCRVNKED
ncbi:MAG: hypothetical protein PVG08_15680 [Desulfobacterales bacterium]|jgi:hypothetical protein